MAYGNITHEFLNNKQMLSPLEPDAATKGAAVQMGHNVGVSPSGGEHSFEKKPDIDMGTVNLARSTINDPSQLFQGKIAMPEKGVGDMGYACKSVSNVMGEAASSLFSALTDKSPGKDGMELEAKPTPQFLQQGPKMGMFG